MDKAFIFDWSGTLSDNFHCFVKVCELMFKEYGLTPISAEEIRLNIESPYMKFWNKYIPEQTQEEEHKLYTKFIHQVGEPELYPGVKETLKDIHDAGYKILILSSDPISKLTAELKRSGLDGLISKFIGGIHDKKETLVSLVKEYKFNKSHTFFVGDTGGEIEAGKFAGLKTIGTSWGFQPRKILAKSAPDFLIDDIKEIKNIISETHN